MSFCAECDTLLPPDAASCPDCGAPAAPAESASPLWAADLKGPPAGPPRVAGDLLLVPTQAPGLPAQHGALQALSLVDGSLRWERRFENALVSGVGAVQTSEVCKTSEVLALVATASTDLLRGQGALLALGVAGEERWRWSPGVGSVSAPAVAPGDAPGGGMQGDAVCVTADARALVLLDPSTGAERNRVELEVSASLAAPAVTEGVAFVPCRGPHLLAVGLDGRPRWCFDAEDSPNAWLDQTPVVVPAAGRSGNTGGRLFAALSSGAVLALRVQDGTLAWRVNVGPAGKRLSPPVSDGQRLYVGARDGLRALDLVDGRAVWFFPTPRRVEAAPVVVGDAVYATCHDHHLYALDAATGRELWRHAVGRRVERSPAVTDPPAACAFIADRGGTLTAVARPLSGAEHEAAGHWVAAASAYAARGQFARGAALLEDHGEPLKAAGLWRAAGEWERVAVQYEAAGAWEQAAELWRTLNCFLKRAAALERHARSLADGAHTDEELCAAWSAAAQAFETEGEVGRAVVCQREVARCLRQPILAMQVQHEGLVRDTWSRLEFSVRNEGFGPARDLIIRAQGDQFAGQVKATRQIATLRAGRARVDMLDVCPRAHGDSVPLRVSAMYLDHSGQEHSFEQTLYIPVARAETTRGAGQVLQISTAGGAVILGDVSTAGGDLVGRDRLSGVERRGPQAGVVDDIPDITPSPEATRLQRVLETRLDLEEFRTLCFHLGVGYDHLAGEGLGAKARELVRYLQRRDALPQLTAWLGRERPDIEL